MSPARRPAPPAPPARTPARALLARISLCALIALIGSACGPRTLTQTFYEDTQTRLVLTQQKQGGEIIDQGYGHPFAIAPVRLAHVLSRLDIRTENKKGAQREPALPTDSLYVVADHLSKALGQADTSQAVAVYYIQRDKRWGIFDHRFLYSFLTYAVDDMLYIHMSHVGWEIPKPGAAKQERLPAPQVGEHPMKFRVIASPGMTLVDSQSVAVDWRDVVFKRPTRTRIGQDGKVVRRTILMESEGEPALPEVEDDVVPVELPETISSATLRALADLEDQRSQGKVTEAEYNARRRQIIRDDPASK
jgi:hypothetical protein